jgi:hypothetical protein
MDPRNRSEIFGYGSRAISLNPRLLAHERRMQNTKPEEPLIHWG